ncbi:CHASE2 domain-containing protein [Candidatus Uabimicrobium sp. HlEnr_7]|uniref:CHASE2 domain-containing protein n=1 Tax=Candidatus Uabimicrobium helgolandensis TaxID=3095367 RepID=UPI003558AFBB
MNKKVIYVLFISFVITGLHYVLIDFTLLDRAENLLRDFYFSMRSSSLSKYVDNDEELNPYTDKDTMIITMDDQSLGAVGKWPWYRDVYGQYVDAVNKFGPKQMQIDITFVLPEQVPRTVVNELQNDPELLDKVSTIFNKSDDKFAKVLSKYDNVYTDLFLVAQPRPDISYLKNIKATEKIVQDYSQKAPPEENPNYRSLEPVLDKFATTSMLSSVNTVPDRDQIVRRFPIVHVYENDKGEKFYFYSSVLNMLLTRYRVARENVVVSEEKVTLKDAHIAISNTTEPEKRDFAELKEKIKLSEEKKSYNKNVFNYLFYETKVKQIDEDGAPTYPVHLLQEGENYHLIDGREVYDAAIAAKSKKIFCVFYKKQDLVIHTPSTEFQNYLSPINYPAKLEKSFIDEDTGEGIKYKTIPTKSFLDGYKIGFVPDFPGKGQKIPQETTDWFINHCHQKRQEVMTEFTESYPEGGEEEFQTYIFEENQAFGYYFFYGLFFEQMAEQTEANESLSFREYSQYYRNWAEQMGLPKEQIPLMSKRQLVDALYDIYAEGTFNYYGKYLFVGAYSTGMADDVKTTPFGDMFGIGIMANAFNTIATGNQLINVSQTRQSIVFFIFAFVLALVYRWSNISYCLGLFVIASLGSAYVGYHIFSNDNLCINVMPLITVNTLLFSGIVSLRLLTEERNRKFLQNTFSQYISPELIEIMYDSKVQPQLGGESGIFTAYFTDIQGFSTFSEKLTATQVVELLNEYLTAMTDILLEEQGTLDKYEGDAIIAFFGAPLKTAEHVFYACRASIRMQDKLEDLKAKWRQERTEENRNVKGLPDGEWVPGDKWPIIVHEMRMRIGINVGEIVVGNMGSKTRMNYTMMGDPVNLAARLESGAKQYGVYTLVSHFTAEHEYESESLQRKVRMDEMIELRFIDKITVVGKSEPIKVYEVISLKGDLSPREKLLLPLFDEAMKLYQDMKWDKALAKFEEALEQERVPDGKTTPSEVFIERCKIYKENPPVAEGEEWDGVFRLASK